MTENEDTQGTDTKAKIKYGEKNLKELLSELIKEQYVILIKNK